MRINEFYEQFKENNRAFQERFERNMLAVKNLETIDEAGCPSSDGFVYVRMGGDFRITGLRIHPDAWESEQLTEERLAAAVTNAYNGARKNVYRKYHKAALRQFGL